MEPTKNVLPGVFALIRESINFYKKNYKVLISVTFVPFVFFILSNLILALMVFPGNTAEDFSNKSIIWLICFVLIGIVTTLSGFVIQHSALIALMKSIHDLSSGTVTSLKETYKWSMGIFLSVFWVYILVFLSSLPLLMFLLVPGIIISGYLSLAVYANIVDGRKGLLSLSASYYYIKGNWWKVFWRNIAVALIALALLVVLAAIVFLLVFATNQSFDFNLFFKTIESLFEFQVAVTILYYFVNFLFTCVLIPLFTIYSYLIYKNVKLLKPEPSAESDFKKSRSWFKVISIFGFVIAALFFLSPFILGIISGYKKASVKYEKNQQSINSSVNEESSSKKSEAYFSSRVITLPERKSSLQSTPYTNKELGFSINLPKNWAVDYNGNDVYAALDLGSESGANLTIQKIPLTMNIHPKDEMEFMEIVASKLTSNKDLNLIHVNYSRYNINSLNAYLVSGTMSSAIPLANIKYYYIFTDNGVYLVTQAAEVSEWPSVSNIFTDSVNTFQVIK